MSFDRSDGSYTAIERSILHHLGVERLPFEPSGERGKVTSDASGGGLRVETSLEGFAQRSAAVAALPRGVAWCRRGDLNPHALAGTSPSSWRVYLFRHSDVAFGDRHRPPMRGVTLARAPLPLRTGIPAGAPDPA